MSHNKRYFRASLLVLVLLIVSACGQASLTSTPIPPMATPSPSATPRPSGKIDVGGYQLAYKCYGQGEPTVIIDAGMGDPPTASYSWIFVTVEIQNLTRICIYDRAGIGNSDKAPTPRTSQDAAKDLHTLLHQIPLPGPYILVGHSWGGFTVRVFTQLYPQEVAGIILVDSTHPDQFEQMASAFPTVAPNESSVIATARPEIINPQLSSSNYEGFDILASAEQVRQAGSLGNIPLIVISRTPNPDQWISLGGSRADQQRYAQIWQSLQEDLATLSSNSAHMTAKMSGHNIQHDEPEIIVNAITQMMQEIQQH